MKSKQSRLSATCFQEYYQFSECNVPLCSAAGGSFAGSGELSSGTESEGGWWATNTPKMMHEYSCSRHCRKHAHLSTLPALHGLFSVHGTFSCCGLCLKHKFWTAWLQFVLSRPKCFSAGTTTVYYIVQQYIINPKTILLQAQHAMQRSIFSVSYIFGHLLYSSVWLLYAWLGFVVGIIHSYTFKVWKIWRQWKWGCSKCRCPFRIFFIGKKKVNCRLNFDHHHK